MPQDLYERWLDLPPGPRPPSPHALLGLPDGQWDEPTVDRAARRQLDKLDRYADHPDRRARDAAARLMNEVARARNALVAATTKPVAPHPRTPKSATESAPAPPPPVAIPAAAPSLPPWSTADAGETEARSRLPVAAVVAAAVLAGVLIGTAGLGLVFALLPGSGSTPPTAPELSDPPAGTETAERAEAERWQRVASELRDQLAAAVEERNRLADQIAVLTAATEAARAAGAESGPSAEAPSSDPPVDPPPEDETSRESVLLALAAWMTPSADGATPDPAALRRRVIDRAAVEARSAGLALDPEVAARLAWVMCESGGNLKDAKALAQRAIDTWWTAHGRAGGDTALLWPVMRVYAKVNQQEVMTKHLEALGPEPLEAVVARMPTAVREQYPDLPRRLIEYITNGDPDRINQLVHRIAFTARPMDPDALITAAGLLPADARLGLLIDAARWSVDADEFQHAKAVIAEADRLWADGAAEPAANGAAAASGSVPPRLDLAWAHAAVGQPDQAAPYARAEWDRLSSAGASRDTGEWAKQTIWLAETFHAMGDLDRARVLWRRAEAAARGLGDPRAEVMAQLAVAVSMLVRGEVAVGQRALQRVADGPAKDEAIFEVVSKLETYDPDIRPLIDQIGDASVRTQAYLVLASLDRENGDRRDDDLRAALEAFALSSSRDQAGPLRGMLMQALIVNRWTDQAIEIGSGLNGVEKVWLKVANAAAMEALPLAEIQRLYEALATSPLLKRTMAHDAVVALAQRGRPADAERLERDLFTTIDHETASVRTGAIALAYLERAELSEAASQVARVRNAAVAREVLGPATTAAVRARHAALLQEAAALAGRTDDWARIFTAAAEALAPATEQAAR